MARAALTIGGLFRLSLTAAIFLPLFLGGAERLGDVGYMPDHVFPHPILLGTLLYPVFTTAIFLVWLDGRWVHSGSQRVVLTLICLLLTVTAVATWSFVIEGGIEWVSDLRPARHRITLPHWLSYFLMLGSLPYVLAIYRAVDMLPAPFGSAKARQLRRQKIAG